MASNLIFLRATLALGVVLGIGSLMPTAAGQSYSGYFYTGKHSGAFQCIKDGFFRDPYNCTVFYRCADLTGERKQFQLFQFDCPPGAVYDDHVGICNHPGLVPACVNWFTTGHVVHGGDGGGEVGTTDVSEIGGAPVPGSVPEPLPEIHDDVPGPITTNVPPSVANKRCRRPGLFRSPDDCRKFYICVDVFGNSTSFQLCEYPCPHGTVFSEKLKVCTDPSKAEPCPGSGVSTLGPRPSTAGPPRRTSTVWPTHRPKPPVTFRCIKAGYFRHPADCSRYYQCVNLTEDGSVFQRFEFTCGKGSAFDQSLNICNHINSVPGCGSHILPPQTTPHPFTWVPTKPPVSTWTPKWTTRVTSASIITVPPTAPVIGETSTVIVPIASTLPPVGTTFAPPVIAGPECQRAGLFPHATNCSRFYHCVNLTAANDRFLRYDLSCGVGTVFDPSIGVCNHPGAVPGCGGSVVAPTSRPQPWTVTSPPITLPTVPVVGQSSTSAPVVSPQPPTGITFPPPVIAGPECQRSGLFPHATNCSRFYRCVNLTETNDRFLRFDFSCGVGTVFDPTIGVCNHPGAVPGCGGSFVTRPPTGPWTVRPVTPTPLPPIGVTFPPPVIAGPECRWPGLYPHATNCSRFYRCVNLTVTYDRFLRFDFSCGAGTVFDPAIGVCNHPSAVPGCGASVVVPTAAPQPWTTPSTTTTSTTESSTAPPVTPPTAPVIGETSTVTVPVVPPQPPIGATVPPPVIAGPECQRSGLFPHASNCSRFYRCVNITEANNRFLRFDFSCGIGTVFDPSIGVCNHPGAVPGCGGSVVAPTSGPRPWTVTSRPVTPPTAPVIGETSTVTVPVVTPQPPIGPTFPPPVIAGAECQRSGLFPHATNCSRFYRCVNLTEANDRFLRFDFSCGIGTVFDPAIGVCNHPGAVPGCGGSVIIRPTLGPQPWTTPSSTSRPVTPPTAPVIGETSTVTVPVVTPEPPTGITLPPPVVAGSECQRSGLFPHATNCSRFYRCVNMTEANDRFLRFDFSCGLGTVFDPSTEVCNHPEAVPGCGGFVVRPEPWPSSSTTTPSTPIGSTGRPVTRPYPVTRPPSPVIAGVECSRVGLFRHSQNCSRFYQCVNITEANDRFLRFDFECGLGTVFDESILVCNHPSAVPGCGGSVVIVPGSTPPWPFGTSSTIRPSPELITSPAIVYPLTSTSAPPISTLPTPVIAGPECQRAGFFPHATNCSRFYQCVNVTLANDRFLRYDFSCGIGSVFDPQLGVCNHPGAVPGCRGSTVLPPEPTVWSTASPLRPITLPTRPTVTLPTRPTATLPTRPTVTLPTRPTVTAPPTGFVVEGSSTIIVPIPILPTEPPPVGVIAGPECARVGMFRHPQNCSRFYQCVNLTEAHDRFLRFDLSCGPGTVFDESIQVCNHPSAVPGCEGSIVWPASSERPPFTARPVSPVTLPATQRPPYPSPGPVCTAVGFIRHPYDCRRFYQCSNLTEDHTTFRRTEFVCGAGSVFDPSINVCNHPDRVPGCGGQGPTPSTTTPQSIITVLPISPGGGGSGINCLQDGFFRHPGDCARFVRCIRNNVTGAFLQFEFVCGYGSVFDVTINVCNKPSLVPGCEGYIPRPTQPCPQPITPSTSGPTESSTRPTTQTIINTPPTGAVIVPVTSVEIVETTRRPTTRPGPPGWFTPSPTPPCNTEGFFRHPQNCSQFYRCIDLTGTSTRFQKILFNCPHGTVFDELISACNYRHLTTCHEVVPSGTSPSPTRPWPTWPPVSSTDPTTPATLPPPVTVPPTSAIITVTDTPGSGLPFECKESGKFSHRSDCSKFYLCQDLFGNGHRFHVCEVPCPEGTYFDGSRGFCSDRISSTDCLRLDAAGYPNLLESLPSHYASLLGERAKVNAFQTNVS